MAHLGVRSVTRLWNNTKTWAMDHFVGKVEGKGLSTEDYTTAEKAKLAGLHNTTVDSALSSTSTNPVQNKAINAALGGKVSKTRKLIVRIYQQTLHWLRQMLERSRQRKKERQEV